MKKSTEIKIKEDVKIGDIILEKGDRIEVLEASSAVFAIEGLVQNPDLQNYIKSVIEEYNIIKVVSNTILPISITSRVTYSEIANNINELKVIADRADVNTLIVWPYIEPDLSSRVIMLSMPQGNF